MYSRDLFRRNFWSDRYSSSAYAIRNQDQFLFIVNSKRIISFSIAWNDTVKDGVEGMSVGLMLGPTRRELPREDLLKP